MGKWRMVCKTTCGCVYAILTRHNDPASPPKVHAATHFKWTTLQPLQQTDGLLCAYRFLSSFLSYQQGTRAPARTHCWLLVVAKGFLMTLQQLTQSSKPRLCSFGNLSLGSGVITPAARTCGEKSRISGSRSAASRCSRSRRRFSRSSRSSRLFPAATEERRKTDG